MQDHVDDSKQQNGWTREFVVIVGIFVLIKLALHFATAGGYGYFRDELYYIVCGQRLDWGYVDHPPLTPLAARVGWLIFGHNLFGLRFFPAVSGAAIIILTALMARNFGGRRFAIVLSCLAVLVAPHYLGSQSKLATDSLEPPFWAGCLYLMQRIVREQRPVLWIYFGLVAGIGMEVKHSIVFFLFALLAALLFTRQRKLLFNRYAIVGALIAFAIALPNLIWEWKHNWATYELLNNIAHSNKNVVLGPISYFLQQLVIIGPVTSAIWLIGVAALFMRRSWKQYTLFAIAYLLALATFIVLKGKNYYLAPIYPILIAAGAVTIEQYTEFRLRWIRPAYVVLIMLCSLLVLPFALPILSPEHYIALQQKTGIQPPRTENSHTAVLPQHFADRFGWDELAQNMSTAFHSLSPEEQKHVGIFLQNYGDAGAIDVLGRKFGLPPALSGHQNYFLWGPQGYTGELLLVVDDNDRDLQDLCDSVETKGPAIRNPYALPFERSQNIYLCRNLNPPLPELWPKLKRWY
jgi:hypothetical protein